MKKVIKSVTVFFVLITMFSFSQVRPLEFIKWKCELPDLEWMTVKEGVEATTLISLATNIAVAAKADADELKTKVGGKLDLAGNFGKVMKKAQSRGYEVTQNFFELYKVKRASLCNMSYLLKKEKLTDTQRDKVVTMFMSINEDFSKMADDLKSKLENK